MKSKIVYSLILALAIVFTACDDDETTVNPIETGSSVTIRNSFESSLFSTYPGFEIFANESPFGDTLSAVVGSNVEFNTYLGLYTIDISNNTIHYKLVDKAPEGFMFRTIEDGTFDRYYIKFDPAQAFTSATVDDEFVAVNILSNTEIQVVISAGYSFTSGHSFNITLN